MVRSACIAQSNRTNAQIAEWTDQRALEKWPRRIVVLQVDAPDAAAAVIEIEVSRALGVLRCHYTFVRIAEMFFYIGLRPQKPLLLAAPEGNPDRTIHLYVKSAQN